MTTKIVAGNSFKINIPIQQITGYDTSGKPVTKDIDLTDSTITTFLVNLDRHFQVKNSYSGNVVTMQVENICSDFYDLYDIEVKIYKNGEYMRMCLKDAIRIVNYNSDADLPSGTEFDVNTTTLNTQVVFAVGKDGKSAYELAVEAGYTGTETEWLNSLKLKYSDLTEAEIAEIKKPAIDAANQALAAADNANKVVESVSSAVEQATNATTQANKAVTDAQTAIVNANKAISNAQQATTDANTATTKANDAATNCKTTDDTTKQNEATRVIEFNTLKSSSESATKSANDAAKTATDSSSACSKTNSDVTQAEAKRVTAENSRVSAESARVSEFNTLKTNSENATTSANNAATKADMAASHAPKIVNNVWQVWDSSTSAYTSTGISALGKDGITPQIRINTTSKNWETSVDSGTTWVDTGITAVQTTTTATVAQETGQSIENVMSQKAVTDALASRGVDETGVYECLDRLTYTIYKDVNGKIIKDESTTYSSMRSKFWANTVIKELYALPLITSPDFYSFCRSNSITKYLAKGSLSSATDLSYGFYGTTLIEVDVSESDLTNLKTANNVFLSQKSLTKFSGFPNIRVSFDISMTTLITHDSLVSVIANLADMTLSDNITWASNNSITATPTLTIGSTNLAKLTDAEKKVATDKGWILA